MSNVCVGISNIYIPINDDRARDNYQRDSLLNKKAFPFTRGLAPKFIKSLAEIQQYQKLPGHTHIIDQGAYNHFPHLLAERMLQFYSVTLHRNSFGDSLQDINRLGLVNTPAPLTPFESLFVKIGTSALRKTVLEPPLWNHDFAVAPVCMERVSFVSVNSSLADTERSGQISKGS